MTWFHYDKRSKAVRFFNEVALFDTADRLLEQIGGDSGLEFGISCNGGDARNALKIFDTLKGRVTTATIHKRAVSAAYVIALTGDRIVMTRGSRIVIHAPVVTVYGQRPRVLQAAESLDELTATLAANLSDRRGIKHKLAFAWYSDGADHVFDADEALAVGLIDEAIAPPPAIAEAVSDFPMTETRADDGKASLLMELLGAIGTIRTSDADKLRRELYAWQLSHIQKA